MTTINIRFANDIRVTIEADVEIDTETDTIDVCLGEIDNKDGKVSLGYDYNYNFAGHRRKAISDELLHDIAHMLKHGFSNRDIADKFGLSTEAVYQIRMARSRRYRLLYEKVGGWPYRNIRK